MILQELLRLQDTYGYLPRADLARLAQKLSVPLYRVHEVASFYPHFRVFRADQDEAAEANQLPHWEVNVCRDMACRLRGSSEYVQRLQQVAQPHGTKVKVCGVACLGRCDRAPAVRIIEHAAHDSASSHAHNGHGHQVRALMGRPVDEVCSVVQKVLAGNAAGLPDDRDQDLVLPQPADQWRINCYAGKPRSERYAALRKCRDQLTREGHAAAVAERSSQHADVLQRIKRLEGDLKATQDQGEIKTIQGEIDKQKKLLLLRAYSDKCYLHPLTLALWTAQLLGMGGAGGRAYKKWSEVIAAGGERRYVVCNGDESEPGTFKDRELLLRTPELVVEGVILAGLLIGAERGYIYIRHEYEEAIAAVRDEIAWARENGLCGDRILGTDMRFEVEVFVSPGGYICGEQTALIQAIQDERSEPRNRPPELQTNGLWNYPTVLNNVETLAWVPAILMNAGEGKWYADQGYVAPGSSTPSKYKGARLFSISGDVNRPGVYEVPIGITLGELIDKYCGGMLRGRPMKAIALSGPSGGFLPPKLSADAFRGDSLKQFQELAGAGKTELDLRQLPLDLGVARNLRVSLGAAIIVYGEGVDLVDQAVACSEFYQSESCGKCVPCRIGSMKLVEIGRQLQQKQLSKAELEHLSNKDGAIPALARTMAETAICGLGHVAPKPLQTLLAYFPSDVDPYLV